MDVGQPYILEEQNNEEVHIPNNFSFRDISLQRNREQNLNYLKVMDVILKPGDCIYIPAYWWYQVQTLTPKKVGPESGEEYDQYLEQIKKLSVTVDFWYHVHSHWLENMFYGIENKLL